MAPKFHPEAESEMVEAEAYLNSQRISYGDQLIDLIMAQVHQAAKTPRIFPPHIHGTRKIVLHRFRYKVIFLEVADQITVVAVSHDSRRPEYWVDRLNEEEAGYHQPEGTS